VAVVQPRQQLDLFICSWMKKMQMVMDVFFFRVHDGNRA
jgi:hypothetical protein